ncbi:MAG TPA: GNAT family N-acetyltransferase [Planctomycetaceae bacterium]|nr:GNAT family N-acetyltransferase [Planctomycetaceae bacterium]
MAIAYFKRYRMEINLVSRAHKASSAALNHSLELPTGFRLLPWSEELLALHAEVKWASFREELDAHVFPCLGEREGCLNLMREIARRSEFVPESTWLIVRDSLDGNPLPCGTIQGLRGGLRTGAIQNIGVHPDCRGLGLGSALVAASLEGFRQAACDRAHLEVTVENTAAIRLYERLGFRRVETLFKISETQLA